MKRMLICVYACFLMLSSVAQAQDSPFKALWPFGKKQVTAPTFDNIDPFSAPQPQAKDDDSLFRLPSPTRLVDKAGATTGAMFAKTKETFRGMQKFGKNLNPFAAKDTAKAKKPKKKTSGSFLSRWWPKSEPDPPATVGEFLSMKRPAL